MAVDLLVVRIAEKAPPQPPRMLKPPFPIIKWGSTGFVQTDQAEEERVPAGTHGMWVQVAGLVCG